MSYYQWQRAFDIGWNDYWDGISYTENPFSYSEDELSLYSGWKTGYQQASEDAVGMTA